MLGWNYICQGAKLPVFSIVNDINIKVYMCFRKEKIIVIYVGMVGHVAS
jgi:hypothetical protein